MSRRASCVARPASHANQKRRRESSISRQLPGQPPRRVTFVLTLNVRTAKVEPCQLLDSGPCGTGSALVALRVGRQGPGRRLAYAKQLAFRAAVSVWVYVLFSSIIEKVKLEWPPDDFISGERFVRGLLFWMLYYWSVGSFDRETWRVR